MGQVLNVPSKSTADFCRDTQQLLGLTANQPTSLDAKHCPDGDGAELPLTGLSPTVGWDGGTFPWQGEWRPVCLSQAAGTASLQRELPEAKSNSKGSDENLSGAGGPGRAECQVQNRAKP